MASLVSRAINGSTAFWGTIMLGLTIAAAYRLLAWLACKFHRFGKWLKGDRKEKVLNRIKAMCAGKLYEAQWGKRMRSEGIFAEQIANV